MMREHYRPWQTAMVIMSTTCALLPCRRGLTDQHATTSVKSTGKRPNIVLVMADDQGYPEVSAHGNPVLQTPNLDSITNVSPIKYAGRDFRLTDVHGQVVHDIIA